MHHGWTSLRGVSLRSDPAAGCCAGCWRCRSSASSRPLALTEMTPGQPIPWGASRSGATNIASAPDVGRIGSMTSGRGTTASRGTGWGARGAGPARSRRRSAMAGSAAHVACSTSAVPSPAAGCAASGGSVSRPRGAPSTARAFAMGPSASVGRPWRVRRAICAPTSGVPALPPMALKGLAAIASSPRSLGGAGRTARAQTGRSVARAEYPAKVAVTS